MENLLCQTLFKALKFNQYEGIEVVKDMICPECHQSDVIGVHPRVYSAPIGWCETNSGLMAIFECPKCFKKFRCHINGNGRYNESKFYEEFALISFLYNNRTNN